jgi:hypothetical protein
MSADARGWRIALVSELLVNARFAGPGLPDALRVLEANGYGLLQLPPPGDHALLLAVIADQVAEYSHHGYAVVALGSDTEAAGGLHWRRLAPLLRHRGVTLPPRHIVHSGADASSEEGRLATFLAAYDLPLAEQRRWRG